MRASPLLMPKPSQFRFLHLVLHQSHFNPISGIFISNHIPRSIPAHPSPHSHFCNSHILSVRILDRPTLSPHTTSLVQPLSGRICLLSLSGTFLSHKTPNVSLNFNHPALIIVNLPISLDRPKIFETSSLLDCLHIKTHLHARFICYVTELAIKVFLNPSHLDSRVFIQPP